MNTLTRAEALETVDEAASLGALSCLAAHWDMAGHWNENAVWEWSDFDALIDEHCVAGDDIRSYGPSDSDMTDLPAWEGVL